MLSSPTIGQPLLPIAKDFHHQSKHASLLASGSTLTVKVEPNLSLGSSTRRLDYVEP
ncbi:MAG: hypothetical protein ACFB12_04710 [Leptolyngbyaceae cyanobacterium]